MEGRKTDIIQAILNFFNSETFGTKWIYAIIGVLGYIIITGLKEIARKITKMSPSTAMKIFFPLAGISFIYYCWIFEKLGINPLYAILAGIILILIGLYKLIFKATRRGVEIWFSRRRK